MDTIRVLIVDDIPETRDHLTKLLGFEGDMEVVGSAASGAEAIELATSLSPDIVLMDINMPDMDGIAATEKLATTAPLSSVIMMSVQGDADYLRRAMLAGAREFLVKPFSADELTASIRQVHQRDRLKIDGDVGVLLNLNPKNQSIADVAREMSSGDMETLDGTLVEHSTGVRVLMAPPSPEMAELVTPDHMSKIIA